MSDKKQSPLTAEEVQNYLHNDGVRCPFRDCRSESIEANMAPMVDAGGAYQEVVCLDCGRKWTDQYTLTGVVAKT